MLSRISTCMGVMILFIAIAPPVHLAAFPSGDLGLLRALKLRSSRELEQRAEAWRPWRAYAAMYLWSIASKSEARETGPLSSKTPKTSLGTTPSEQGVSVAV